MIVPMKRLTLVTLQKDQEETVKALEQLGVVHVTHVRAPSGDAMDEARGRLGQAERVLLALTAAADLKAAAAGGPKGDKRLSGEGSLERPEAGGRVEDPDAVITQVGALLAQQKDQQEEREILRNRLKRIAPFGDFDPAQIHLLAQKGISVILAQVAVDARPVAPEGVGMVTAAKDGEGQYLILSGPGDLKLEDIDLGVGATEVKPPDASPSSIRARLAELEGEMAAAAAVIESLAANANAVAGRKKELEEALAFVAVREGMGEAASISYLEGYVPADEEGRLRQAAGDHGWGLLLEKPRPGERVPTLLRYSRWVKPVQTVLNFLGIYPGYEEPDIGWTFLIFFSLFFAMLIGDAAYGVLLAVATIVIRLRLKNRVPGYITAMLAIVSVTTFIWGVLTGTWLGLPHIPAFLDALSVPWLAERDNLIWLCFLIGATHLSIAHVWNALVAAPKTKILAEIGWLGVVWTMFFLAGNLVIQKPLPAFVLYMFGASVLLIVLFMATPRELKTEWINHALLPLTLITNFVDVVSYVRLFAVGFASVAVIQSFNSMANSIGWDSPITAVFAVLILVFAHSLNLVLGALGVLVHAVRLNTLEFSTHKGVQWQGFTYKPFGGR